MAPFTDRTRAVPFVSRIQSRAKLDEPCWILELDPHSLQARIGRTNRNGHMLLQRALACALGVWRDKAPF